jgi:rod shape-determining protein MreC
MSGRLMGYGHRAPRVARRRLITYAILLGFSLILFAASGTAPVRSLQAGLHFALAPALETVNSIGNQVRSIGVAIGDIDRLRSENATLAAENERLAAENRRLQALGPENEQLSALLQIRNSFQYKMAAARVVARDVVDVRRVVTIDKGRRDGLAEGDVVVTSGGALAGRITEIGDQSARVTLISDPASVVIGEIVSSRATGEIRGDLGGTLVMDKVDATKRLEIGDEVVTAGIVLGDGIRSPYPRGLIVGSVQDASRDPNAIVQTAYLKPAADLDRLEVVLVITDYEGGIPAPSAAPGPAASPGTTIPDAATPTPVPTPTPKATSRPTPAPTPTVKPTKRP